MIKSSTHPFILLFWLLLTIAMLAYLSSSLMVRSDVSFFLPDNHTTADAIMMHQLKEGEAGKLILMALSFKQNQHPKNSIKQLADINKQLANKLRQSQRFAMVQNGQQDTSTPISEPYYQYRYLLTQETDHFSNQRLTRAFNQLLQRLEMMLTPLEQQLFSQDPQMLWLTMLKQWQTQTLDKHHGVWFDQAGEQTLLFVKTFAEGYDLKQQKENLDFIRQEIAQLPETAQLQSVLCGSPVFALESKRAISQQIQFISVVASLMLMSFLFWFFRSVAIILLISLPLAFAIITGLTCVIFIDGFIHGITIAFGITIIGIAVDYPVHYYSHRLFSSAQSSHVIHSIWPKIRLGLLTTLIGFSAITVSDFSGLRQLGLFAISGLFAAAMVTRFLLPRLDFLTPNTQHSKTVPFNSFHTLINSLLSANLKWFSMFFLLLAMLFILSQHNRLWENDLSALSPVPQAQKKLDFDLRKAMGLPELRYVLILQGQSANTLLQQSEKLKPVLDTWIQQDKISGYDMAANYLPSLQHQQYQQQHLPSGSELTQQIEHLLKDMPLTSSAFEPFIDAAIKSQQLPLLSVKNIHNNESVNNNFISAKINTLIYQQNDNSSEWSAIIPLQGVKDELNQQDLKQLLPEAVSLLDLKVQTESMLSHYRDNALLWFVLGSFLILVVLWFASRGFGTLLKLVLPFTGALLLTIATLLLLGFNLSIFHLVTLLLVVGLGIDYSIFTYFSAPTQEQTQTSTGEPAQKLVNDEIQQCSDVAKVSVIICLISTLIMFGALSFSELPVLKAIGLTASLGAFYAFCLTVIINSKID